MGGEKTTDYHKLFFTVTFLLSLWFNVTNITSVFLNLIVWKFKQLLFERKATSEEEISASIMKKSVNAT